MRIGGVVSYIFNMEEWLVESSFPWSSYQALITCQLIDMDKLLGVCTLGIGKNLCMALENLVLHAVGNQAMLDCGNL